MLANKHYYMELSIKEVSTEAPDIGISADMWVTTEQAQAVATELGKLVGAIIKKED